jgi:hypothetical protein
MSTRGWWLGVLIALGGVAMCAPPPEVRTWLAGDSHIHSHWSPGYDRRQNPPVPLKGLDAIYSTPRNAAMAREHGLNWMVTTDHGGPNHSQLNFGQAYRELQLSRRLIPEVLQFYGMELNMPGMDHHTLIIPRVEDEAEILREIEAGFDQNEGWELPSDPTRRGAPARRRLLQHVSGLSSLPLMFANHPSRSASGVGVYGLDSPQELRQNSDLAPRVYRGMEGAPGHQAATLQPDGTPGRRGRSGRLGVRGVYRASPTRGGFDQMTAIVGGLWDSLLGEGRRFWIVATSDSHVHYADPVQQGADFWPGEYQKTYVKALPTYDDVLDGLREGRIFAVAGDLVSELDLSASAAGEQAGAGGALSVAAGTSVDVTIRFRDPEAVNAAGENPTVARVDLIVGRLHAPLADQRIDRNPTARVAERFGPGSWSRSGEVVTITTRVSAGAHGVFVRVRGTNTAELEPAPDPPGESPWQDLWFYSNPLFIEVE